MGQKHGFQSRLWAHIDALIQHAPVHGLSWLSAVKNRKLRGWLFGFVLVIVMGQALQTTWEVLNFLEDSSITQEVKEEHLSKPVFPNITLCHPLYFETVKMLALGVKPEDVNFFASILTYTFLPNGRERIKYFFNQTEVQLDLELLKSVSKVKQIYKDIEETSNVTDHLEIMKKSAVSCDTFVFFCEGPDRNFVNCCPHKGDEENDVGFLFDPEPIFTHQGTCFKTRQGYKPLEKASLENLIPQQGFHMSVIILTNVDKEKSPVYSLSGVSTRAYSMLSPWFALHNGGIESVHHALEKGSEVGQLRAGKILFVPIKYHEDDRSNLLHNNFVPQSQQCANTELKQKFESKFGFPYSFAACEAITEDLKFGRKNCSILPYYRMTNVWKMETCGPLNVIQKSITNSNKMDDECLLDCHVSSVKISDPFVGEVNEKLIERSLPDWNSKSFAGLHIFIKSLDKEVDVFLKQDIPDYLSILGGKMSFIMGASFISNIEMAAFYFSIVATEIKNLLYK